MTRGFTAGFLEDPAGYALVDFVPFSAEVYFRLIERVGETFWPLHGPALMLGLAALTLAWRGSPRVACALLAVPWAWVGITFVGQRYAELNWAGSWFADAFLVQAGLLLILAAAGIGFDGAGTDRAVGPQPAVPRVAGLLVAGFGVIVYPVIAPLSGFDLFQAETFGIHPDPTAVTTLGIVLMALRGPTLWLAMAIPVLWCVISGLTLQVLDAAWTFVPLAAAALAGVFTLWKTVRKPGAFAS